MPQYVVSVQMLYICCVSTVYVLIIYVNKFEARSLFFTSHLKICDKKLNQEGCFPPPSLNMHFKYLYYNGHICQHFLSISVCSDAFHHCASCYYIDGCDVCEEGFEVNSDYTCSPTSPTCKSVYGRGKSLLYYRNHLPMDLFGVVYDDIR